MWIFWTILLTIVGVGLLLYSFNNDDKLKGLCGFMSSFILLIAVLIYGSTLESIPTALDVYRGKTMLEYTIKGGEIVDSVVVYK